MRVDTRAGSEDLVEPLTALGVEVEECQLDAGDIEIIGNGPDNRPTLVGVEYKKLGDLIQSMRNGRFADQLRKMKESYEINWLLVEGTIKGYHPRSPVFISKGKGRPFKVPGGVSYHEICSWSMTMCMHGGVLFWRTSCLEESAAWLRALNMWWTSKEWSEHSAMLDFYTPPLVDGDPFLGPTLAQEVARCLPRLGSKKAAAAGQRFGSVRGLVEATEEEWIELDRVGKKEAALITHAINTEGWRKR